MVKQVIPVPAQRDILLRKRPRTDGSTKMSLAKTGNLNIGALEKCCSRVKILRLHNEIGLDGIGKIAIKGTHR